MINQKLNGVKFGELHSYHDFGLIMQEKNISSPEPQSNYVSVPGRNGVLDYTEVLTGNVRYKERNIKLKFFSPTKVEDWAQFTSDIQNKIAGRKIQIVFDDDKAFYWLGRVTKVEFSANGASAYLQIEAIVDPYKYTVVTSADRWLWDPFDFEQGIINEACNMVVNENLEFTLLGYDKYTTPIVISDSEMELEFETFDGIDTNTVNVHINEGDNILYECIVTGGVNIFRFTGNGVVTINYTGGSL